MAFQIEKIAGYLPALVLDRVRRHPTPISAPAEARFQAAALLADISGFTALTEKLAERGAEGVEELSKIISTYFGKLVAVVSAHGGDIVKFAGDAVIAIWPAGGEDTMEVAARRAAACALAVQDAVKKVSLVGGEARLSLRAAVGVGKVATLHVGGLFGRWEVLLAGEAFVQAGAACGKADPGDVVASKEAVPLLGDAWPRTFISPNAARLGEQPDPPEPRSLDIPPLPQAATEALLPYIPAAVRSRIEAGHTGWLAELRRVTVLFIKLATVDENTELDRAQSIMRALQTSLYRFEGSVNKVGIDDKGVTFIGVMGLPPLSHEDDAARGVQAALAIDTALRELGIPVFIGVTTGRAFCGSVGNARRCEYTIMGGVVNLAARLMTAVRDGVLCDAATHDASSRDGLGFAMLEPIQVKGRAEPIAVFKPLAATQTSGRARRRAATGIVGRRTELATLQAGLDAFSRGGRGGVVVIEGEPGIGKSTLVQELERSATARGVRALLGSADSIERKTPYLTWRGVFTRLFDLEEVTDPVLRRERVFAALDPLPELRRIAPLLNVVLPLEIPENEHTRQMTGEVRGDNTHDLLLALLRQFATGIPLLIIIEDAHWKDSASWAFTRIVARDVTPLMLVLATRPLSPPIPAEMNHLLATPGALKITLDALAPAEAVALVCRRLGVDELPPEVASLVQDKAQGNPFFAEELAYALRDAGRISVEGGVCRLAPGVELKAISVPDTVQGIVTERIDRLDAAQQLTLKVASAVGRVFSERIVREVYPVDGDRPKVLDHLRVLQVLDLTPVEAREPERLYIFKHAITQEVAYNLMLFAQRRELHREIAHWYERTYAQDLASFYGLLAHHYTMAEDTPKAVEYLERAGERAMKTHANEEAIQFLEAALVLDEKSIPSPSIRRARWEGWLGEAHYALARLSLAREHFHRALALMGFAMPTGMGGWLLRLLKSMGTQLKHRMFPGRYVKKEASAATPMLLEAARANERLCQIYYIDDRMAESMSCAVVALNLSEGGGPSPELARSYGNTTVTASLVLMHGLARFYNRHAIEEAGKVKHAPSAAYVQELTGLYSVGIGDWLTCEKALVKAIAISEDIGDRRRWDESVFLLGQCYAYQGRLKEARQRFWDLHVAGKRRAIAGVIGWGLSGRAFVHVLQGGDAEAVELLAKFLASPEGTRAAGLGRADEVLAHGVLCLARYREGAMREARIACERGVALLREGKTITNYILPAYHGLAEVSMAMDPAMSSTVLSNLGAFAFIYPNARPCAKLWKGVRAWVDGKKSKAIRLLQRSAEIASELKMPIDEGAARRELQKVESGLLPTRLSEQRVPLR